MAGSGLGLTERDRTIVREVGRLGAVTRQQLTRLGLFTSRTRANERLKRLVDAGYLAARLQPLPLGGPRLVYLPGRLSSEKANGRPRVAYASGLFVAHQLGLTDIRITFETATRVTRWLTDRELEPLRFGVIPDAYVEYECAGLTYCAFVEYDRQTETLARIERKVRAYLSLAFSGGFEQKFGRKFFRLLLITDSERRLANLSDAVASVTDKVVRLTTRQLLLEHSPASRIWRRPSIDTLESLTTS